MVTKTIVAILVLSAALAAWVLLTGGESHASASAPPTLPAAAPRVVATEGALEYRGVALQMQTAFGPVEAYTPLLREIAALGANTLLRSSMGLMEHARQRKHHCTAAALLQLSLHLAL